jgi:hypothetical protein
VCHARSAPCRSIHYIIAKGTLDDRLWPMLERKLSVVSQTLDGAGAGGAEGMGSAAEASVIVAPNAHGHARIDRIFQAVPPPAHRAGDVQLVPRTIRTH